MYLVVFEGTGEPGRSNWAGIRTWTDFTTKEEFDAVRADIGDIILAEGITEDRARYLVSQTSGAARFNAALLSARGHPEILEYHLTNAALAAAEDGQYPSFRLAAAIEYMRQMGTLARLIS